LLKIKHKYSVKNLILIRDIKLFYLLKGREMGSIKGIYTKFFFSNLVGIIIGCSKSKISKFKSLEIKCDKKR